MMKDCFSFIVSRICLTAESLDAVSELLEGEKRRPTR